MNMKTKCLKWGILGTLVVGLAGYGKTARSGGYDYDDDDDGRCYRVRRCQPVRYCSPVRTRCCAPAPTCCAPIPQQCRTPDYTPQPQPDKGIAQGGEGGQKKEPTEGQQTDAEQKHKLAMTIMKTLKAISGKPTTGEKAKTEIKSTINTLKEGVCKACDAVKKKLPTADVDKVLKQADRNLRATHARLDLLAKAEQGLADADKKTINGLAKKVDTFLRKKPSEKE